MTAPAANTAPRHINGLDPEALDGTLEAIRAEPTLARFELTLTGAGIEVNPLNTPASESLAARG